MDTRIKIIVIQTFGLFVVLICFSTVHGSSKIPEHLITQVDLTARLLGDSFTQEFSREYLLVNNTREERGAIVILGLSGFCKGNNSSQFMIVYYVSNKHEPGIHGEEDYYSLVDFVEIGGRDFRFANPKEIKYSYNEKTLITSILIPFKLYAPIDPSCCPSLKSTIFYSVKIRKLNKYG
jgi:hypothetical protein